MSIRRHIGALALAAMVWALAAPARAQNPPPAADTPAARYRALEEEFVKARDDFFKTYEKAKTDEERQKLLREKLPKPEDFAPRFLKLVDAFPKDPAAVDALIWVASLTWGSPPGKTAADRLMKDHITSDRLGPFCFRLANTPDGEASLRSILERNPHREVQGQATLALALSLKSTNDEAKTKEAESLLERVQEKYADVKLSPDETLVEIAKNELNEIRNLGVGKPAPEIDGEDIDGKPMKLSEYRGKVVVLDFFGHWCEPCRAVYPHGRSLVQRLQGKPFVFLGINSDEDREQIKETIKEEKLAWRSWWDGGSTGAPISTAWNVRGVPTLYILDHKGIIRHKFVGFPGEEKFDGAIEDLIKKAVEDRKGGG